MGWMRSLTASTQKLDMMLAVRPHCRLSVTCRYSWAAIAVLGVLGSQVWSYKLVKGLFRQLSKASAAQTHAKVQ